MKKRLDIILTEKNLVPTRSKARAVILAGEVFVNDVKVDKVGQKVDKEAIIEIRSNRPDYVSRGGLKLAHALKEFKIDVKDLVCVDIGSSTGGFTDCLLKNGAKKVYAIDVGYGQLDYSLRNDQRVVVLEKTNIRDLDVNKLEEPIDLVVIDVSFIGLEKVFPKVSEITLRQAQYERNDVRPEPVEGRVIALIKPQFQVGKGKVGKGGVVRDESLRQEAIETVRQAAEKHGWKFQAVTESPIKGPKGNIEYLALILYPCSSEPHML